MRRAAAGGLLRAFNPPRPAIFVIHRFPHPCHIVLPDGRDGGAAENRRVSMGCTGAFGQGEKRQTAGVHSGADVLFFQHGNHERCRADYLRSVYIYRPQPAWCGGTETACCSCCGAPDHCREPWQHVDACGQSAEPVFIRQGRRFPWLVYRADAPVYARFLPVYTALECNTVSGV